MTTQEFIKNYWNYYLLLEKQVLETQRYVDFNTQNNATYSIEYLQLFLSICSEIDVVAKIIAKEHNPNFSGENINKWGPEVDEAISQIQSKSVVFNNDYIVTPWHNWYHISSIDSKGKSRKKLKDNCKNPEWWILYNKVKHQRTSIYKNNRLYFSCANLKNVVFSLSALFILEMSYIDSINTLGADYKAALLRIDNAVDEQIKML